MGTIKKAQICWGKKSGCGFTCQDLHKRNVGGALKKDAWQSVINVNTGLKKMLACFTGQCSPLSGRDTYSVGSFFEGHGEADRCSNKGLNNGYGGQPWSIPHSGAYTCIVGPHNANHPIHYWASGATMCRNQNHEIGGWSNCNHGKWDSMHIRVQVEESTESGLHCEHNSEWEYIMEVEDDVTVNDIPDSPIAIGNGYNNKNAYYIGNKALNALNIVEAEVCFAKKTTSNGKFCGANCMPLEHKNVGGALKKNKFPHVESLESGFKKMIACFTGQCPPVSGQDSYSRGFYYECHDASCRCSDRGFNNGYGGQPWSIPHSGAYTCGVGPHNANFPMHFWASGVTMCNSASQGNYEIGGWSNCNHGKFNTMQIRVKTQKTDNGLKCPKAAGWNYVMQIEDDPTMQDMPHNANEVANGFKREHANYIGNEALNKLNFRQAQICFGKKDKCGAFTCMDINDHNVGSAITKGKHYSIGPLTGNVRKILGCFTGQCGPVGGRDGYGLGWFFTATTEAERCSNLGFNNGYAGQPWSIPEGGKYTCGVASHNNNHPFHFWASGYTMCWDTAEDGNYEIGGWSNCNHGKVDSMHIRVR
jgi:hypothetical protein